MPPNITPSPLKQAMPPRGFKWKRAYTVTQHTRIDNDIGKAIKKLRKNLNESKASQELKIMFQFAKAHYKDLDTSRGAPFMKQKWIINLRQYIPFAKVKGAGAKIKGPHIYQLFMAILEARIDFLNIPEHLRPDYNPSYPAQEYGQLAQAVDGFWEVAHDTFYESYKVASQQEQAMLMMDDLVKKYGREAVLQDGPVDVNDFCDENSPARSYWEIWAEHVNYAIESLNEEKEMGVPGVPINKNLLEEMAALGDKKIDAKVAKAVIALRGLTVEDEATGDGDAMETDGDGDVMETDGGGEPMETDVDGDAMEID